MELAESIKSNGIIQPLILRKDKDEYIIVAGERRWRAAKYIGIKEIPAVIMDLTEKTNTRNIINWKYSEGRLNSIEEAIAYKKAYNWFWFNSGTIK